MIDDLESGDVTAPLDWRRLFGLLRPIRRGLVAMMALSTGGVLMGLVPPLALGVLVNALVERNDRAEAAQLAGLIALAILVETAAYVFSDGVFARNAGRLYRNLRLQMFEGVRREPPSDAEERSGLASRFISDAEAVGGVLTVLDSGAMQVVEFGSAFVALAVLAPWTIVVVAPQLILTWVVTRRMQQPVASAAERRQEELERVTQVIAHELERPDDPEATNRFKRAVDRLLAAEIRVGWLEAVNLQGSGGLAKIGPIAAVVVGAFTGTHLVGTLIALYLLAQRAFWGFDGLVDLSLGLNSIRGAVARCFALVDRPNLTTL
jgi:ABC-type multidrug transport system fused ATPase/permease subunit